MLAPRTKQRRWWRWPGAVVGAVVAMYVTGGVLSEHLRVEGEAGLLIAIIGACAAGSLAFYLIARNVVVAVLVGAGVPIALAAFFIWTFARDDKSTYPKGPVSSIDPLTTFADFPIYWLGRNYHGVDLTQIHTQLDGPPPLHIVMYLTYGYGVCGNRGLDSYCTSTPILLVVQPACSVPPIRVSNDPDGYVWTRDVAITAQGTAKLTGKELLRDLSLVNVSKFPNAEVVDSQTYASKFRSACGDQPAQR